MRFPGETATRSGDVPAHTCGPEGVKGNAFSGQGPRTRAAGMALRRACGVMPSRYAHASCQLIVKRYSRESGGAPRPDGEAAGLHNSKVQF